MRSLCGRQGPVGVHWVRSTQTIDSLPESVNKFAQAGETVAKYQGQFEVDASLAVEGQVEASVQAGLGPAFRYLCYDQSP